MVLALSVALPRLQFDDLVMVCVARPDCLLPLYGSGRRTITVTRISACSLPSSYSVITSLANANHGALTPERGEKEARCTE